MEGAEGNTSAPDFVTALEGWRVWLVRAGIFMDDLPATFMESASRWEIKELAYTEKSRLSSMYNNVVWPHKKEMVASCECSYGSHQEGDHTCGLYCLRSEVEAIFRLLITMAEPAYKNTQATAVIGKVDLWGTVHEHEYGYRAEFMYPKQLWVAPGYFKNRSEEWPKLRYLLERDYGVPVSKFLLRETVDKYRGDLEVLHHNFINSQHFLDVSMHSGMISRLLEQWAPRPETYYARPFPMPWER